MLPGCRGSLKFCENGWAGKYGSMILAEKGACTWDTGGIGSVFARRGCQKTIAVDVGESWGNYGT